MQQAWQLGVYEPEKILIQFLLFSGQIRFSIDDVDDDDDVGKKNFIHKKLMLSGCWYYMEAARL